MVLWRLRRTVAVVDPVETDDGSTPSSEASATTSQLAHDTVPPASPYKATDPITAVRQANQPGRSSHHTDDKKLREWKIKRPQNVQLALKSKRPQIAFSGKPSRTKLAQSTRASTCVTRTEDTINVLDIRPEESEDHSLKDSERLTAQKENDLKDGAKIKQDDSVRKKPVSARHSDLSRDAKLSNKTTQSLTRDRVRDRYPQARARRGSIAFPLNHSSPYDNHPNLKVGARPKSSSSLYWGFPRKHPEEGLSLRTQTASQSGQSTIRPRELSAKSSSTSRCLSPQPSFASEYIAEIFQTSDKFLISRPESGRQRPASARPPLRPTSAQPQSNASATFRSHRIRPASALPRTISPNKDRSQTAVSADKSKTSSLADKNLIHLQGSHRMSGNRWSISSDSVTKKRSEDIDESPSKTILEGSSDFCLEQQEHESTSNKSTEDLSQDSLPSTLQDATSSRTYESHSLQAGGSNQHSIFYVQSTKADPSCLPQDADAIKHSRITQGTTSIISDLDDDSESVSETESLEDQSKTVTSSCLQFVPDTRNGLPMNEECIPTGDDRRPNAHGENQMYPEMDRYPDNQSKSDNATQQASPHLDQGTRPASPDQPQPRRSVTRKDLESHFREEKQAVLDDLRSDLGRRLKLRKKSGIMSDTVFQKQVRSSFWTADMLYHRWGKDLFEMRNKWNVCTGRLSDQSESKNEESQTFPRGRRFAFSNERTEKDSTLDFKALRSISMGIASLNPAQLTTTPSDSTSASEVSGRGQPAVRRTATTGSLRSTPPLSRQSSKVEVRPQAFQNLADLNVGLRLTAHLSEDPEARRARLRALFIATVTKVMRIARVAMCMTKSSKAMNMANFMAQIHFYNTRTMEEDLTFEKEKFSRKYSKLHVPNWAREVGEKPPWERTPDDVMALYSILKNLKSFEKFTHQMRMEICRAATYSCCEKGRVILRQGHVGHNFYFIFSGSVFVQIDIEDSQTGVMTPSKTSVMEKGSSFGELALLGGGTGTRRASIICRETTELFEIEKETFLELCPDIFEKELQEKIAAAMNIEIFHHFPADALERLCFESFIEEVTYDRVIERDTANTDVIFFILEGKVTMLKEFNLSNAYRDTSIEAYGHHVLPTPRPAPDVANRGRQTLPQATDKNSCFMRVGELRKGDCTEIALLHASEDRTSPGVILLSNGVRIMQMSKRKLEQLAPREVLDKLRRQPVQPLRIPTSEDLYRKYLGDVNWAGFKSKVVETLHEELEGAPIVSKPSTAKGSTGWARWPGSAVPGSPSCAERAKSSFSFQTSSQRGELAYIV